MKMHKENWIALGIFVVLIAGLFALNAYTLHITQGHYNALQILFL